MKGIRSVFLKGLLTVLPLAVTVYILYWIGAAAEAFFGGLLKTVLHDRYYVSGMGLALGIVLILAIGVLMHVWFVRRFTGWGSRILNRIPLVKTLYGSTRDLMAYFSGSHKQDLEQVAMLSVGGARLLGLVTRIDFAGLPEGIAGEDDVAIYLPMSYQVGGFTLIVPRSSIQPVAMSFQEAMRLNLTAFMTAQQPAEGALPPGPEAPRLPGA